jgi:uncharacterized protein YukJ
MALNYGVLKGIVTGHLRDADDDHYQILVRGGKDVYRIASNVKSSAPKSPSTLFFQSITTLPDQMIKRLRALPAGFTKLPSKPGGLAFDYLRSGLVKVQSMTLVPPDAPGADNDLKDKLEDAVVKAMQLESSTIYAFGSRWGPEKKKDQYFKFLPGNGIHDIHMNQGNSGQYKKDNGIYQDGALFISYPDNKWRAFFFAFQSQSFKTDSHGNPLPGSPKLVAPAKSARKRALRR